MGTMNKPLILLGLALFGLTSTAQAQTLYSSAGGLKVSEYGGWTTFVLPPATETFSSGATVFNFNSTNSQQGGFSRSDQTLNRTAGYTLNFTLKVDAETHDGVNGPNRSGVSVIALSSDLMGIELSFWNDRIWAQSGTDFLKAEEGLFDTASSFNSYSLQVSGSSYSLFANVLAKEVVSGSLRNYSAAGIPYNLPNFLFFGDNTTSARGTFSTTSVVLSAAPEPGTCCLLGLGLGLLTLPLRARRR